MHIKNENHYQVNYAPYIILQPGGHYESGNNLNSGLQSLYYHPVNDLFPSIMYRNEDCYALQYNAGIVQSLVIEYFLCIFME